MTYIAEFPFSEFQSTRPIRGATKIARLERWLNTSFQSTRPIRGATRCPYQHWLRYVHFNPRAPYGARRSTPAAEPIWLEFQSTRPIRGATSTALGTTLDRIKFQSTRPIRGATLIQEYNHDCKEISIHAPHTGRDGIQDQVSVFFRNFNPRAPYGARRNSQESQLQDGKFQSTRPIRGATQQFVWH